MAFVEDVADYLKSVGEAHSNYLYLNMLISSNCIECRNFLSTTIINLQSGSLVWRYIL